MRCNATSSLHQAQNSESILAPYLVCQPSPKFWQTSELTKLFLQSSLSFSNFLAHSRHNVCSKLLFTILPSFCGVIRVVCFSQATNSEITTALTRNDSNVSEEGALHVSNSSSILVLTISLVPYLKNKYSNILDSD